MSIAASCRVSPIPFPATRPHTQTLPSLPTRARALNATEMAHADSPSLQLSRSSCLSCRQLKRKCSRQTPHCALCMRVGRVCEYDTVHTVSSGTAAEPVVSSALSASTLGASQRLPYGVSIAPGSLTPRTTDEGSIFLEAVFLDSVRCRGERIAVPSSVNWRDVCHDMPLATTAEAGVTLETFFTTTHTWLPIGERNTNRHHCPR